MSTIRARLTAALALALLPVLILGIVQAEIAFHREGVALRQNLQFAAARSAASARARMEAADILLQTLAPDSLGFSCAMRLSEASARIPEYSNLIRFDKTGRVACAASSVPADADRAQRVWFQRLQQGGQRVITSAPGARYANEPVVLAAIRTNDAKGDFDGAIAAVISLSSLKPRTADPSLPSDAQLALVDGAGAFIGVTEPGAFRRLPTAWRKDVATKGSLVWYGDDAHGDRRVYSAAPLVGDDVFVIVSAESPGLFSWARLNPLTGVIFPLMTFGLAFLAVWVVADRVVVRWIVYLQRIAALYARGRLSVRPLQAEHMPPEIRELAETLEDMADAIVGRDASLRESLAQKDALMREIHHRVKNNLQTVAALLRLQARRVPDPTAQNALAEAVRRVGTIALVHETLSQGFDETVDFDEIAVRGLRAVVEVATSEHPIHHSLTGTFGRMRAEDATALAMIVSELVQNAAEHGLADRGGTIDLAVQRGSAEDGSEELTVTITDDGNGLPHGFRPGLAGLGTRIVTSLIQDLQGRIRWDNATPRGTRVEFVARLRPLTR